jgi:hypothetical protein
MGMGMDVRVEHTAYQATIHARRNANVEALCGALPGSPWTKTRAYVTCASCRAEVERRVAARHVVPSRSQ